MDFTVKVVEGVGKKSGKPYKALDIIFPNGYTKRVFLEDAELFLLGL